VCGVRIIVSRDRRQQLRELAWEDGFLRKHLATGHLGARLRCGGALPLGGVGSGGKTHDRRTNQNEFHLHLLCSFVEAACPADGLPASTPDLKSSMRYDRPTTL